MNKNNQDSKKKQATGLKLTDKDYIKSILSILKELSKNYVMALTEASNEALYEDYLKTFLSISQLQREAYEIIYQNGWYQVEKAPETKINQKLTMIMQEYNDLSN